MATQYSEPSAPLWVCVDCYLTHEGYGSELDYTPDIEPLSLIPSDVEVTAGMLTEYHECDRPLTMEIDCECETRDFSWSHCEGCGSHLGGTRHALTLWYNA